VRFKLDENLGTIGKHTLAAEGHDVMTVLEQRLSGKGDQEIFEICSREDRALVTLDQDFAQTLRFAPNESAGIIVLRTGGRVTPSSIEVCMLTLLAFLRTQKMERALWIVEPGRVRVHE
jgi:predicted nuclease of predicted toxin-antitoxin system